LDVQINREGIRKPAWFAYKYLHALRGREIPTANEQVLATSEGKRTAVLAWNWTQPEQKVSNRPFFTKVLPAQPAPATTLRFSRLAAGSYTLSVYRTGFHHNDAHTRYLEMGSPSSLTAAQIGELQGLTADRPERSEVVRIGRDGSYTLRLPMRTNDVVLATLEPALSQSGVRGRD
jgi:xylan 1,4-beta-xylosidase